jgi:hypothetical protein
MSHTRIALVAGIVFLAAFVVLAVVAIHAVAAVAVILILAALIACGNLLYGRHSHGAAAQARVRPAQDAHDRAAAVAADARRAVAQAARRGERYCPLDPGRERAGAQGVRPPGTGA